MPRYIDADLLKKDLKNPDLCNVTDKIISIIDIQPTADVQPVVHGEWNTTTSMLKNAQLLQCSVCGQHQYVEKVNYCPNCGAKMDGGNDEPTT